MTDEFETITAGMEHIVCDMPMHEHGESGCFPQQPGSVALEYTHLFAPAHHGIAMTFIVCVGHAAWVRSRSQQHVRCPTCGLVALGEELYRIIGPVERIIE